MKSFNLSTIIASSRHLNEEQSICVSSRCSTIVMNKSIRGMRVTATAQRCGWIKKETRVGMVKWQECERAKRKRKEERCTRGDETKECGGMYFNGAREIQFVIASSMQIVLALIFIENAGISCCNTLPIDWTWASFGPHHRQFNLVINVSR